MAMKPGMRMLMMDKLRNGEHYPRSEYGGDSERRMIGYNRDFETENRRGRDYRGRYMEGSGGYEHTMPRMGGYGGTEARRRRDSRGRYMIGGDPRMMDDDYDEEDMRSQTWYPPHMMGGSGSRYGFGDVYASIHAPGAMNRPGMTESGDMSSPVDEHTARMWVGKMDGGEHFKIEQAEQMRNATCPDCDKWEFYVALNAMYSDHCETAKKLNVDRADFYSHLAKDFLNDKDAKPHKLRRYMEHIAK